MFLFGKFKTSFNVNNGTKKKGKHEEVSYGLSEITGAYRINRNEFSDGNFSESQGKAKRTAPVVPTVPAYQPKAPMRQKRAPNPPATPAQQQLDSRLTKSTSDLIKDKNLTPPMRQAQSGVSLDPRGASEANRGSIIVDTTKSTRQLDAHKRVEKKRQEEQKKLEKQRLEEEKRLEKQRLEEQKKKEKLALQEQARQDKLKTEREKKEKKTKRVAPQRPLANPLAQSASQANNQANQSTNTLNSSISKTSGPPPYTDSSSEEIREDGNKSNVEFVKPEDTGSWDLVSQHRQNVIVNKRANLTQPVKGQTTIDLNYTLGESKSDA